MPANRDVTSVETYSGQYVDLLNPDPKTIRLEDIAIGLANTARFAGQTTRFYSVAEHAVRVSRIVPTPWALHHDSHEAYIGDIIAPLKKVLRDRAPGVLAEIANALDFAIMDALGMDRIQDRNMLVRIKTADDAAMYAEASALKWSHGTGEHWLNDKPWVAPADIGWSPERAVRKFIERHEELSRGT